MTIKYATLSEYFNAVAGENIDWPVYTDDFFPYADGADAYWTGFYTTHSELKGCDFCCRKRTICWGADAPFCTSVIRDTQSLQRTTELFAQAAAVTSTVPLSY